MLEFIRIFQNEWIKLIRRRRFAVVLLLGLALIAFYSYARYHESENQKRYNSPAAQTRMMDNQIKQEENRLQTDTNLNDEQKKSMQAQIDEMKKSRENIGKNNTLRTVTKEEIQQQIDNLKKSIAALAPDKAVQRGELEIQLKVSEYQLTHLPEAGNYNVTSWKSIQDFLGVGTQLFIPLLCVLLVADMVSGEQTGGTIKLLLTRPASRGKILFAKYITSLIGAICIITVLLAVLTASSLALFGSKGGTNATVVGVKYQQLDVLRDDGTMGTSLAPVATDAKVIPMRSFAIQSMLLTLVATIAMCTLGFFCSVLVRSAAVSTGISIAVIIIGTIIIHAMRGASWLKFFLTPNFDLSGAWAGSLSHEFGFPMSLMQSLVIIAVWVIGMYAIGHFIFKRRDILA